MGRNEKTSFDFFRVETDFFSNKKIKSLRRLYGPIGLSTYLYLLAYIYGHDGYYVKFSSLEDLSYDIAEAITGDNVGKVARRVAECINYLADSDLIDKGYLAEGIITSVSMQGQYIAMCKACRRLINMPKYCLIDEDCFKSGKKEITSEEIPISSEEISISSEKKAHIKLDKIREDISLSPPPTPPTGESEENTGLKVFLESHPNIEVDGYNGKISDIDFDRLSAAIAESDFLKEVTSFLWLCNQYEKVISGYYKTIKPPAKSKDGTTTTESWTDILARI